MNNLTKIIAKIFLILAVGSLCFLATAQQPTSVEWIAQEGDLLFQEGDCGAMCEAIARVTDSWKDRRFTHVGMVVIRQDSSFVLESSGEGVNLVTLEQFLARSVTREGQPKVAIGRLHKPYRDLIPAAVEFGLKQIGTPYDFEFIYDNGAYYCSELIYDSFLIANANVPFFTLHPMTFKDPDTGKVFPGWEDYFSDRQLAIPEGKPGCNPGGISLSEKLDMIYEFQ